jgi:acetyl esterase/lipase
VRRPPNQLAPARPNLLARSILTSLAFLFLFLPALAVAGGYTRLLPIAGFGRLLITDLPWLVGASGVALMLALVALRLGGRFFTKVLATAGAATLALNLLVGVQFALLAANLGATYDVVRQAQTPAPVVRTPSERIVFAEVGDATLHADVWRPGQPSGAGVLFIHGGGFTHGGLGLRPRVFALLADAGATVLDVEYRLSPPPRWQDARADVLCALGWFEANASTYGVDPTRIVVMGESAGGNLALVAAYAPGSAGALGLVQPSCDVDPQPPAGVIAVSPTADLVATWTDVVALGDSAPFPADYTGGTPTEVPDRYRDASVAPLIGPGLAVRTLLIAGDNDGLVTIARMRTLADQLRAAGVQVQLVEVPFADHAFDGPENGFGMQLEETLLPSFLSTATGGS